MRERIRTVLFKPYRKGRGLPTFILHMFDEGKTLGGKCYISYQLRIRSNGNPSIILFQGDDFGCSPMHAIDSDGAVKGLMSFLTLRPGDTDWEYFRNYTAGQFAFCEMHAETLSLCVMDRFGE